MLFECYGADSEATTHFATPLGQPLPQLEPLLETIKLHRHYK